MELRSKILEALDSCGNLSYQVLYNYNLMTYDRSNVHVRTVSDKNGIRAEFGVYKKEDRRNQFLIIEGYADFIEERLANKVIADYDFSKDFVENKFIIEINHTFRLINIVQLHFKDLLNKIYINDVAGNLEIPSMTLVEKDKEVLFNYFENLVNRTYSLLVDKRVNKILMSTSTVLFYKSLEQFVPVFFSGPCIINPILDCGKYSKVFKQTKFYEALMAHRLNLENNSVSIMTNKEICLCLGLDRFVPFDGIFLTSLILGIFDPVKFTSPTSYRYLDGDGRLYFEEDLNSIDVPRDQLRRVSSLYLAVRSYARRLRITNIDLCVSILENVTLVQVVPSGNLPSDYRRFIYESKC